MQIIQSRLEGVPGNIVDPDAIQFASRKVAAVSGDARRCLDICRRAVELAEAASNQDTDPSTPSKRAKAKEDAGKKLSGQKGIVTINTIRRAIDEATSSPMQQFLRSLPLSSKLFLSALLAKLRRTGISESVLGEVIDEAKRMAKMSSNSHIQGFLLSNSDSAFVGKELARKDKKAPRVLGMGEAASELMEAGIIAAEWRGERSGKVRLNVGDEEVRLAFKDDQDVKGLF